MARKYAGILIPLASAAGALLLSACNTVEGVGRDVESAGVGRAVRADKPALVREPFVVWAGAEDVGQLSLAEVSGLLRFLKLGGTMVVPDSAISFSLNAANQHAIMQRAKFHRGVSCLLARL